MLRRRSTMPSIISIAALCVAGMLAAGTAPAHAYPRPGAIAQVDHQPNEEPARAVLGDTSKEANYSSMSDDGRYVAFDTVAALLPIDTNNLSDVYVRDRRSGRLTLVSIGERGDAARPISDEGGTLGICYGNRGAYQSRALSWDPAISGNGRHVAFVSLAMNLVEGDTNLAADVFVFDLKRSTLQRVSLSDDDEQLGLTGDRLPSEVTCPASWAPSIDKTGKKVTFTSDAKDVSPEPRHSAPDVFVRNLKTRTTRLVSVPQVERPLEPLCEVPNVGRSLCDSGGSGNSSISSDGRSVAFDSGAGDLVPDDTNRAYDVFVRDLSAQKTERVSVDSQGRQIGGAPSLNARPFWQTTHTSSSLTGDTRATQTSEVIAMASHPISADGRYVTFVSDGERVVPSDGTSADVYVRDRKTGRTERVSVTFTGNDLGTLSTWFSPSISRDGRFVVLEAYNNASNNQFVDGSATGIIPFVYDRATGAQQPLARPWADGYETGCNDQSDATGGSLGDISATGRFVSYATCDPNLQRSPWRYGTGQWDQRTMVQDRGEILAAYEGPGGFKGGKPVTDDSICIVDGVCIPPLGAMRSRDTTSDSDAGSTFGADIYGASLSFRPAYADIFARVQLVELASAKALYGLRFTVGDVDLEVRGRCLTGPLHRLLGSRFTLFRSEAGVATPVAELQGGCGTTGEEVVFSIPLHTIGLRPGGTLSHVEALTALGTEIAGPTKILDSLRLK